MALFNITIERVIVKGDNEKIIQLLEEIKSLLPGSEDEALRQEIFDKLTNAIADIKSTV